MTRKEVSQRTTIHTDVGRFATSDRTARCPKTPERLSELTGMPIWLTWEFWVSINSLGSRRRRYCGAMSLLGLEPLLGVFQVALCHLEHSEHSEDRRGSGTHLGRDV